MLHLLNNGTNLYKDNTVEKSIRIIFDRHIDMVHSKFIAFPRYFVLLLSLRIFYCFMIQFESIYEIFL